MNILVALDKFKDSLTAEEACQIVAREAAQAFPQTNIVKAPLTDGGEGFSSILTKLLDGQTITTNCTDPIGRKISTDYGIIPPKKLPTSLCEQFKLNNSQPIALIEMARASGLELLSPEERNLWNTSTYGTGLLIADAIKQNVQAIFLGLGGSATNDLGCGALSALGTQFKTENSSIQVPSPVSWTQIEEITFPRNKTLPTLFAICDVDNPLLGQRGCSAVYGPQKGLKQNDLKKMENAVERMSKLLCQASTQDPSLRQTAGAGAAGGIAYGLSHYFTVSYTPGFNFVSELLSLKEKIDRADWIITGEGMFDESSLEGKGPGTLVEQATVAGKRIDVFAGKLKLTEEQTPSGVSLHQISLEKNSLAENLRCAKVLLQKKAKQVFTT